jgi:hypothetical protein
MQVAVPLGVGASSRYASGPIQQQSPKYTNQDPDYGDLGPAFPAWTGSGEGAFLQPPRPQIRPSARVLERVADRDAGIEAGQ